MSSDVHVYVFQALCKQLYESSFKMQTHNDFNLYSATLPVICSSRCLLQCSQLHRHSTAMYAPKTPHSFPNQCLGQYSDPHFPAGKFPQPQFVQKVLSQQVQQQLFGLPQGAAPQSSHRYECVSMYQINVIVFMSITYLVEFVDFERHAIASSVDLRDGGFFFCTYLLALK